MIYLGFAVVIALQVWILINQLKERKIMSTSAQALAALQEQVAQNTSIETSAVTLIQGLAAQIAAAGTDPAALQALTTSLNSSATALAAAIAANTPAAPPAS